MPINNARVRASRHRPVSCHFCRSRKLRCSRQLPCSNCTTRGLNCQLYGPQESSISSTSSKRDCPSDLNSEIFARLSRLEEIVTRTTTQPRSSIPATSSLQQTPSQSRWQQPTANDPQWLERACMDQNSSVCIALNVK